MTRFANLVRAFAHDEEGIALSEYLVLLGILIGGVILAVTAVGDTLNTVWYGWSDWFANNVNAPA